MCKKILFTMLVILCVTLLLVEGGTAFSLQQFAKFLLLTLFVFIFRLLDDLATVESDKINFPNRVLCRCENLKNFWRLWSGPALLLLVPLYYISANKWLVMGQYLFLTSSLLVWYHFLQPRTKSIFIIKMIPLFKYPLIILLLANTSVSQNNFLVQVIIVSVLLLVFITYEVLEDPLLRPILSSRKS